MEEYTNGYIERKANGTYKGRLSICGINISPIEAVFFKKENDTYMWLKRCKVLEYDDKTLSYVTREPKPRWEAYLKKQKTQYSVAFKGEFTFMRFKFSAVGIFDSVLGTSDKRRINLYVERLPMNQQTVINAINERKRNEQDG